MPQAIEAVSHGFQTLTTNSFCGPFCWLSSHLTCRGFFPFFFSLPATTCWPVAFFLSCSATGWLGAFFLSLPAATVGSAPFSSPTPLSPLRERGWG